MSRKTAKQKALEAKLDQLNGEYWETFIRLLMTSENDKEAQRIIQNIFEMTLANVANMAHFLEIEEVAFEAGIDIEEDGLEDSPHLVEYGFEMECQDCNEGEASYELQRSPDGSFESFEGFKNISDGHE